MVRALVSDVDGVIANTAPEIHKGCVYVCRAFGITPPDAQTFFRSVYTPFIDYYRSLGLPRSVTEKRLFQLYFQAANHDEAPTFPDVAGVVRALVERGMILGVVSGHNTRSIERRFMDGGFFEHFRVIRGNTQTKDVSLRQFCRDNQIRPGEAMYLGDLISDMRDAVVAGVIPVGVTRTHGCREALTRAGAQYVVTDLTEVLDLLSTPVPS